MNHLRQSISRLSQLGLFFNIFSFYFRTIKQTQFVWKIRTRCVGVEDMYADHSTTTTTLVKRNVFKQILLENVHKQNSLISKPPIDGYLKMPLACSTICNR